MKDKRGSLLVSFRERHAERLSERLTPITGTIEARNDVSAT